MSERRYVAYAPTDEKTARRLYRTQNAIWIALGVAAIAALISFLVDPRTAARSSAVGHVLHNHVDLVWSFLYGFGGLAIGAGAWFIWRRLEMVGHIFFTLAILINAIAVVEIVGVLSTQVLALLSIGTASAIRGWFLYHHLRRLTESGEP